MGSGISCTGRTWELRRLRSAFRTSLAREGGAVIVGGPPGSGSELLLDAHACDARAAGAKVWRVRSVESSRPLQVVSALANSLRRACREEVMDTDAPALLEVLLGAVGDGAVVVMIEDMHHADQESLEVLARFAASVVGRPVHFVLHHRSTEDLFETVRSIGLVQFRTCAWVELGRLDPPQVVAMSQGEFGVNLSEEFVVAALRKSGGSHDLVRALLIDTEAREGWQAGPVAGPSFAGAILAVLSACTPAEVRVAQQVALLDRMQGVDCRRMTGLTREEFDQATAALHEVGLTCEAMRDLSVRRVILRTVRRENRQALNLSAARALHSQGARLSEVADLLLEAGVHGREDPWVAQTLRAAASAALANAEVGGAVRYLSASAAVKQPKMDRIRALNELICLSWDGDPTMWTRSLEELTEVAMDGELDVRATLSLLRHLTWADRREDVAAVLSRCDVDETVRGWMLAFGPGLLSDGVASAERRGVQDQAPTYDGRLLHATLACRAWGLAVSSRATEMEDRAVNLARKVLGWSRPDSEASAAIFVALGTLQRYGRFAEVEGWSAQMAADASSRGGPACHAFLGALRAEAALGADDPKRAMELSERALTTMSRSGWGANLGLPLGCMLEASVALGDISRVEELLRWEPSVSPVTWAGLRHLRARGQAHLAVSHGYAALDDFLACGAVLKSWGIEGSRVVSWSPEVRRTATMLGLDPELLPSVVTAEGTASEAASCCDGEDAPPDLAGLSRAEIRVAQLAASGLTNKTISIELYITVSTVEQHLTRIYRKLSLDGRAALAEHRAALVSTDMGEATSAWSVARAPSRTISSSSWARGADSSSPWAWRGVARPVRNS